MTATDTAQIGDERSQAVIGRASIGALSLLLANAGMLFIYFAYDLSLYQLVFIYWWECLWIGVFSALKLVVASAFGDPYGNRYVSMSLGSKLITTIVLLAKVSAVYFGLLVMLGLAILAAAEELALSSPIDAAINQVGLIFLSSAFFLLGHGLSFVVNYLLLREFKHARAVTLMWLPFKRCLALLAAIGIAFAVVFRVPELATTAGFASIIIALKVVWDLWLHYRERRSFALTRAAIDKT